MKKQLKKAVLAFTLAVSSSGMAGKFDKYGDSTFTGVSNARGASSGSNPLGMGAQEQREANYQSAARAIQSNPTLASMGWGNMGLGLGPTSSRTATNFMFGASNPQVTANVSLNIVPKTPGLFDRFGVQATAPAVFQAQARGQYDPMAQIRQMQANQAQITQATQDAQAQAAARLAAQPLTDKQKDLQEIDLK